MAAAPPGCTYRWDETANAGAGEWKLVTSGCTGPHPCPPASDISMAPGPGDPTEFTVTCAALDANGGKIPATATLPAGFEPTPAMPPYLDVSKIDSASLKKAPKSGLVSKPRKYQRRSRQSDGKFPPIT